jgi:hypothetical protein
MSFSVPSVLLSPLAEHAAETRSTLECCTRVMASAEDAAAAPAGPDGPAKVASLAGRLSSWISIRK